MASTILSRTPSGNGNNKTWTYSAWVKRTGIGTWGGILDAGDGSSWTDIYFYSDDKLVVRHYTSGSAPIYIETDRLFRDPNAWYHIVVAVDTTQSTASNRVKIYVNGVQETSLGSPTYPSQNYDTYVNSANAHRIGISKSTGGSSNYFDGILSHVHLVDGSALAPTVFGSTDSTTGEWKINTSPSYTVGTNGFFILKDTNSGTDQSANSNNFTVSAGTLTKTEDCPSNVFATLNPLAGSLSNNTLTQGNNTFQSTSGWRWRPSTICASSGKYYAEFKPTSGGNIYTVVGVTPQVSWDSIDGETIGAGSSSEAESVGFSQAGSAIKGNSTVYSGSTYTTNDIIGVALDLDNYKVYFSKNGTWQNSGVPTSGSTGTGAVSLSSTLSDWSISVSAAGSTISCNYGNGYFGTTAVSSAGTNASNNGIFEYDVPTGYTALSTKGLNT
jgi:hypothetical protein